MSWNILILTQHRRMFVLPEEFKGASQRNIFQKNTTSICDLCESTFKINLVVFTQQKIKLCSWKLLHRLSVSYFNLTTFTAGMLFSTALVDLCLCYSYFVHSS